MKEVTFRSVALRSFVAIIVAFTVVSIALPTLARLAWQELSRGGIKDYALALTFVAILYFMILVHWRNAAEEKEQYRKLRSLPIPLFFPKLTCPAGGWIPFVCKKESCRGGFLAQTVVFGGHSITNGCRLNQWNLNQIGQALEGKDRLFCVECGTEHDSINEVAARPLNLYNILGAVR